MASSAPREAFDRELLEVQLVEHREHNVLTLECTQERARARLEVLEHRCVGARELAVREHGAVRLGLRWRVGWRRDAARRRLRRALRAFGHSQIRLVGQSGKRLESDRSTRIKSNQFVCYCNDPFNVD